MLRWCLRASWHQWAASRPSGPGLATPLGLHCMQSSQQSLRYCLILFLTSPKVTLDVHTPPADAGACNSCS